MLLNTQEYQDLWSQCVDLQTCILEVAEDAPKHFHHLEAAKSGVVALRQLLSDCILTAEKYNNAQRMPSEAEKKLCGHPQ